MSAMRHDSDSPDDSPSLGFMVELQPQGWRFDAPADQSLLLAALDHGLRLPHSCRNGTCRACIARLVSGRVEYLIDWPGLLREEKGEGWILPCVACARTDLVLDQPQAINFFDVPVPPGAVGGTAALPPSPPPSPAPRERE